jgi:hypothetical protein
LETKENLEKYTFSDSKENQADFYPMSSLNQADFHPLSGFLSEMILHHPYCYSFSPRHAKIIDETTPP